VSGLLQQYSVGSDDAFDDVEKCKPDVKLQIMLKYVDMVVRDVLLFVELFPNMYAVFCAFALPCMSIFSYIRKISLYIMQYDNPCLLQRMTFSDPRPYLLMWCPSFFWCLRVVGASSAETNNES
jgi:hypothetical protein